MQWPEATEHEKPTRTDGTINDANIKQDLEPYKATLNHDMEQIWKSISNNQLFWDTNGIILAATKSDINDETLIYSSLHDY